MYKEKLAVAIKSNGKILRETKDLVHLPFGSEFSVLVKNLDNRRVKFKLKIDGADVLDGTEIIVNANSEAEIKRFIRNGNMDIGNAFKFIERTEAIENGPRGIKIEDGIVQVEFWFEQVKPVQDLGYWKGVEDERRRRDYWGGSHYGSLRGTTGIDSIFLKSSGAGTIRSLSNAVAQNSSSTLDAGGMASTSIESAINDAGITVAGSAVEQKFTAVYGFVAEAQSNVIVLKLVGKTNDVVVTKAVTVKTKPVCTTCGRTNKATSKFCSGCGTSLTLL